MRVQKCSAVVVPKPVEPTYLSYKDIMGKEGIYKPKGYEGTDIYVMVVGSPGGHRTALFVTNDRLETAAASWETATYTKAENAVVCFEIKTP